MHIGVKQAEDHEYPGQHDEDHPGEVRDIGEYGQHIEQDRNFELIAENAKPNCKVRFDQFGSRSAIVLLAARRRR